jgi:hypothetical protein
MSDPNLPPPFPIVEDDLVYVITGYNKINCLPDSRESSIQNLRRYLVRISGVSGIGVDNDNYRVILFSTAQEDNLIDINYSSSYPYYQSIATTGLNARVGNNMEIQFTSSTPAANKYGGVGGKYFSGIISTTGLNTKTENLIVRDFESIWPYSGIIYNTGLNARVGNNMEIQFTTGTPAANKYGGAGGKYTSGIISTTGLNARTENLIVRDFENTWPYSGIIYNTGLNAVVGNNIEIQFSSGTPAADKFGRVGNKYFSGIISTTGLNARTENLIVREFESTWPYSGVIYNTGLNAVVGNNMEIQFAIGTAAANKYGRAGGKYVSGIISTTGLNAKTANNVVLNFDSVWPYSGTIYNSGLNARAGNNIEIDFSTTRHPNMGPPYYSGTISTTGLNIGQGNGIKYSVSENWPYPYELSTMDYRQFTSKEITISNITGIQNFTDLYLSHHLNVFDYPQNLLNNNGTDLIGYIENKNSGIGYICELSISTIKYTFNVDSTSINNVINTNRPTDINGNIIDWTARPYKIITISAPAVAIFLEYSDGFFSNMSNNYAARSWNVIDNWVYGDYDGFWQDSLSYENYNYGGWLNGINLYPGIAAQFYVDKNSVFFTESISQHSSSIYPQEGYFPNNMKAIWKFDLNTVSNFWYENFKRSEDVNLRKPLLFYRYIVKPLIYRIQYRGTYNSGLSETIWTSPSFTIPTSFTIQSRYSKLDFSTFNNVARAGYSFDNVLS